MDTAISYYPDFRWPVPRNPDKGYRWVDGRLEPEMGATFRDYEPAEDGALFLNFADTPATPEAILSFANRYGLLGYGAIGPEGETVDAWRRAIAWFKMLLDLHKAARRYDYDFISDHLQWERDSVRCDGLPRLPGVLSGKPVHLDRRALQKADIRKSHLESVALVFLAEALNAAFAECAPYALFLNPDGGSRLVQFYRIRSLFGLMVVQLEHADLFIDDYTQCVVCGRWFALEPGVNRADRITCSDACRQKLHRQRRAQALRLHGQGKTVNQIATEVGSSPETVANWINAKEPSKPRRKKEH